MLLLDTGGQTISDKLIGLHKNRAHLCLCTAESSSSKCTLKHVLSGSDAHLQLSRRKLEHLEVSEQLRCSSPLCKQALSSGAHGQHPDTGTSTSFIIIYAHFELGGYRRLPEEKAALICNALLVLLPQEGLLLCKHLQDTA